VTKEGGSKRRLKSEYRVGRENCDDLEGIYLEGGTKGSFRRGGGTSMNPSGEGLWLGKEGGGREGKVRLLPDCVDHTKRFPQEFGSEKGGKERT